MENKVMKEITKSIEAGERVALVTLIEVKGSTPADAGNMMAVWENGRIEGTIGGGKLEYQVIQESIEAIKNGKSYMFHHSLTSEGDLEMKCGGTATGFIKIFLPPNKLIMVGGGHVGEKVISLAKFLDFHVTVIDDREDFLNKPSLQEADKIIISPYSNLSDNVTIDKNTYVVIATKGHLGDLDALEQVIRSQAKYVGVIGSLSKNTYLRKEMLNKGYSKEDFNNVYAPVGLNISDQTPKEISVSIMSEILAVKNSREIRHMDKSKMEKI